MNLAVCLGKMRQSKFNTFEVRHFNSMCSILLKKKSVRRFEKFVKVSGIP